MHSRIDLAEVVGAVNALRGGLGFAQRRQQKRGQNADDGNDHQQLDESKGPAFVLLNMERIRFHILQESKNRAKLTNAKTTKPN